MSIKGQPEEELTPKVEVENDVEETHIDTKCPSVVTKNKKVNEEIVAVLTKSFPNGYRLNSAIARKRFAKNYVEEYSKELLVTEEVLERQIAESGIAYNGMVYIPSNMIDGTTRKSLFDFIEKQFASGIACIYYNVLFENFSQQFLGQTMIDGDMLHMYLEYNDTTGTYHFESQYFSKGKSTKININDEVLDYVKAQGGSVTEDELVSALSHFPKEKVVEAFIGNRQTLVLSGIKTRFHIDNFQLEINDRLAITDYLSKEIKEMQYVTFSELYDKMETIAPRIIENNIQFNQTGIRTALSCLLGDEFHFVGSFISDHDNPISIQDAFIAMGRNRDSFTIDEVEAMADDLNAPINFYALAENNVRISEELYVSKQNISFDISQVDRAIERFCKADFISLSDVNTFTAFPECGYRWTPYLLESFIYSYSKMFTLEHKSFNKTSVTGAIVRRPSRFNDYNDVMAAALANAEIILDVKSSLDFLAKNGYIERRRLNTIDEVVGRAQQLKMK